MISQTYILIIMNLFTKHNKKIDGGVLLHTKFIKNI